MEKEALVNFGKWYSKDEAFRKKPELWTSIVDRYLEEKGLGLTK